MAEQQTEHTEDTAHIATARVVAFADPEQCWRALTTPSLVAKYMFGTQLTCDWKVGSPISYRGVWDNEPYEDKGSVVEVDEPRLLVTTFFSPASGKKDAPENYQTVRYEIRPIDGGCRIQVFQDNNESKESAEHSSDNWLTILKGMADVARSA